ncbi:cysteine desulfurase family protein [Bauldia sp.]|uniref:cysteine desulfurase family protein n=1 Tax=Bauldia sp. TaxID=2575872 RepID=UPI003BAA3E70
MQRLYLDYNATAPLRPEAREALVAALEEVGNASSVHAEGRAARQRIETARQQVAALVGADPKLVTFTSGGTEANTTVVAPDWRFGAEPHRVNFLLVGAAEHVSVLAGGRFAPEKVQAIAVDSDGLIQMDGLRRTLEALAAEEARPMVSVMLANNETGVIQPIAEIADLAHGAGAIVHTDAIQAVGRIPVDIAALGVDVLTLSAHKIGGPQGAGAIIRANDALTFPPLLLGGGQESRLRGGTENVAAIAGFGAAAEAASQDLTLVDTWSAWRDRLAAVIGEGGPPATVYGAGAPRLPQTLCVGVDGIAAETLVIALDLEGVAVSSGSACSSGKVAPSHVLAAMGVPPEAAKSAIRLSLGWESDENILDLFQTRWRRVLETITRKPQRAAPAA